MLFSEVMQDGRRVLRLFVVLDLLGIRREFVLGTVVLFLRAEDREALMAFLAGLTLQRFLGFLSVFLLLGGSRRGSGVQGNGAPAQGLAGGGLNFLPSVMIPDSGFLRLNGCGSRNVCRGEFRPRVRHGILLRSRFGGGILPDAVRRFVPRGGCLFLLRCTVYMYGRLLCLLCAFLARRGLLRVLLRRFGGGGKLAGARIGARFVVEGFPQLAGRFLHRHHLGGTVFA